MAAPRPRPAPTLGAKSLPTSDDALRRARIISHMNADHRSHISMYVQHLSKLPASIANTAELRDIELGALHIAVRGADGKEQAVTLPLEPPMASWGEARERLVAMVEEAQKAGFRETVKVEVTRWVPPQGVAGWGLIAFILWTGWILWDGSTFAPGGVVRRYIFADYAPLADWYARNGRNMLATLAVVHLGECALMGLVRLPKYGVTPSQAIWWKWVGCTFIDGFSSMKRLSQEVKRVKAAAAAAGSGH